MSELTGLRELATLAAREHVQGRSFKRSAILTPFTQMIEALERWPKPEDRGYLRAMLKNEVSAHIERALPPPYKLTPRRTQAIYTYVDRFFDVLLNQEHHGNAQHLLERARLLKGAYLIFFREAVPPRQQAAIDSAEDTPPEELDAEADS
jgi:hypothetical protein